MISLILRKSNSFVFLGILMGILSEGGAQVPLRLSRHVNTAAHEYLPCPTPSGDELYFCGMDRTGFFDYKLDFIKYRNSGGEDVFMSRFENGMWSDARPVQPLNTNGHECITQVISPGHFLIAGNYEENIGIQDSKDGLETADLFEVWLTDDVERINHLPEPVNSLWTEGDGWRSGEVLLFVSDRPGELNTEYHMKGWFWNGHNWGNTDVFVAFEGDFGWEYVKRLPPPVNTSNPERTPRLSTDGLKLWVSQWTENRGLEVVEFRRTNASNWDEWSGPYPLDEINTLEDDWGYLETENGTFWATALPLKFNPTAMAPGGDAGAFRETNFRPGYTLKGRQTAALSRKTQTDIFWRPPHATATHFEIRDILFEFNSATISEEGQKALEGLADWCLMNKSLPALRITGHTDAIGSDAYNLNLSQQRAKAVGDALQTLSVPQAIITEGRGESDPLESNESTEGRAVNRRVCFQFLKATPKTN